MVRFYLLPSAKRQTNILVVLRERKLHWGKRLKILDNEGLMGELEFPRKVGRLGLR